MIYSHLIFTTNSFFNILFIDQSSRKKIFFFFLKLLFLAPRFVNIRFCLIKSNFVFISNLLRTINRVLLKMDFFLSDKKLWMQKRSDYED
jgi:hypothetical protein